MPLHLILAIAIVVAIAFYVSIFNSGSVNFNLTSGLSYNIPIVVIVLVSVFIGALLVALMNAVNVSQEGISRLLTSARSKRFQKIHQPYENGLNYLEAGYPEKAEEEFKLVLERDAKHVPTLVELGKLKLKKGDYEETLRLHNRAFMLDNRNLDAAFCLIEDYTAMGRYTKAQNILEKVRGFAGEKLVASTRLREICIRGQLWEEALKVQKEIVRHTRDRDQAEKEKAILNGIHHELGQKALGEGRNNDALKEFRAILKSERDFAPAYAGIGDVYLAMGRESEVLKTWEEGYDATLCPSLLKKQENLFLQKEDPGSAIALYKSALKTNPRNAVINYLLGLVYLKLEMMEEALQEFKKVQAAGAMIPGMGSLMAGIYERTGKQELATQEYKREMEHIAQSLWLFKCVSCGELSPEWRSRCSRCGEWNTYRINFEEGKPLGEKVMPPPVTGA